MLTKKDINWLSDTFVTKGEFLELKNEFFNRIDAVLFELKAMREDMAVAHGRQSMHSDVLENHEERLVMIEGNRN